MLSYAEEILLLALDDETGAIKPLPAQAMHYALAGALLIELAMAGRIDTDLQTLRVTDRAPTGDALLDDVLQRLTAPQPVPRKTSDWLGQLVTDMPDLQERVLARLVDKGVLRIEDRRILWVFAVRRYPLLEDREVREVRARLRAVIDSDDIPSPEEAVLIALVNACDLFDEVFTPAELRRLGPRIDTLSRLDLIGREVASAVDEISRSVAAAMLPHL
ncbi:GPP34 family phosphoprotein [Thiohalocapsa marina]|uniref:GPP34 family phosphoprotein n=1 Tax=Thiohalocapsa marina TaxID=424902 RepID=A0A5M8FIQ2_9GAMM|nr:GPP34 family phosphoprotein [Thiohalocapsa marina]KAA6184818.1 GPP34 family phosphoprotein [Thiohalocapsa marina]